MTWDYPQGLSGGIIPLVMGVEKAITVMTEENDMPKDKAMYSFELEKEMMEFMEQMTAKYDLPDVSKAMRCLINYALDVDGVQDAIFAEMRCLSCG